ncbi:MAG TPA: hypothetical protein VGN42_05210 [Pirellulales bacterium]|jgi:hypothetical protein|nr:hypothetical protein [Pirellulales bacterium]
MSGVRRQLPFADQGDIEASCQIEVELANAIDLDGEAFRRQARLLNAAWRQAVEDQLSWRDGNP